MNIDMQFRFKFITWRHSPEINELGKTATTAKDVNKDIKTRFQLFS
jgi:hypothetical protein